jgi:hypothetical protein
MSEKEDEVWRKQNKQLLLHNGANSSANKGSSA